MNGQVDGRAVSDRLVAIIADLGAHDDLDLSETPRLLSTFNLGLDSLASLGGIQDRQALALERAREPVRASG